MEKNPSNKVKKIAPKCKINIYYAVKNKSGKTLYMKKVPQKSLKLRKVKKMLLKARGQKNEQPVVTVNNTVTPPTTPKRYYVNKKNLSEDTLRKIEGWGSSPENSPSKPLVRSTYIDMP